jgi:lysophospholipase L1-like esterase
MILGWSFDPLTEFWNIEIVEDGYIKTLDDRADFSERSKIVLVGGSTVAGAGATSFKKTIASNIQRLLNEKELPYKVINAGTGGWTSSNQVSYLLHKLPYEKDVKMVVFLDGYNDLMRGFVPRDCWDSHLCSKNRLLKARRLENSQIAEGFRCVA